MRQNGIRIQARARPKSKKKKEVGKQKRREGGMQRLGAHRIPQKGKHISIEQGTRRPRVAPRRRKGGLIKNLYTQVDGGICMKKSLRRIQSKSAE